MEIPDRISPNFFRKSPDAVMFDWDSTLFNNRAIEDEIASKLLNEFGKKPPPSPEEMNKAWDVDPVFCCEKYFPGHSVEKISVEWRKLTNEVPIERLSLLPGAEDVLKNLTSRKIPIIIVSNKPRNALIREIKHFGLIDCFKIIIGGDPDYKKRKPSHLPIIAALNEYNENIGPDEKKLMIGKLWFVGDHFDDAGAARSDGIQRYIVGQKHRHTVKSHAIGGDPAGGIIYLDSISELNDIINRLPPAQQSQAI